MCGRLGYIRNIERHLKLVDEAHEACAKRHIDEFCAYAQKHSEKLALDLATTGAMTVPMSDGPLTITYDELVAYLTPDPPKYNFWKRALSIFKGVA